MLLKDAATLFAFWRLCDATHTLNVNACTCLLLSGNLSKQADPCFFTNFFQFVVLAGWLLPVVPNSCMHNAAACAHKDLDLFPLSCLVFDEAGIMLRMTQLMMMKSLNSTNNQQQKLHAGM